MSFLGRLELYWIVSALCRLFIQSVLSGFLLFGFSQTHGQEAYLWLSGSLAFSAHTESSEFVDVGDGPNLLDASHRHSFMYPWDALIFKVGDEHLLKIMLSDLQAGRIRSHKQFNLRLAECLGVPSVVPPSSQIAIPPPVDCRWGTLDLYEQGNTQRE